MHAMNINKSISKICVGVFSERYFLIFKLRLLRIPLSLVITYSFAVSWRLRSAGIEKSCPSKLELDKYSKITHIIDISGSLETSGKKDISKINIFLENISKVKNEN